MNVKYIGISRYVGVGAANSSMFRTLPSCERVRRTWPPHFRMRGVRGARCAPVRVCYEGYPAIKNLQRSSILPPARRWRAVFSSESDPFDISG